MSQTLVAHVREKLEKEIPVTGDEALELFDLEDPDLFDFFAVTNRMRHRYHGQTVRFCSIVNAKSNMCGEDCSFCSQASTSKANIKTYPLMNRETLLNYANRAEAQGASEFSIVTSGRGVKNQKELDTIRDTLRHIRDTTNLKRCGSLGVLSREALEQLKEAGMQHLHHNLETSRRFYNHICTTRTFDSNVETVRAAVELGFDVCSGGIFGMGETREDRIDMALTLRELDVESVPLNFLNPVEGTALAGARFITPLECLKCIGIYRALLPTKSILVMGGREVNLRDLQSMIFLAGANGTLLGNYLTTSGRDTNMDLQMLRDLELSCSHFERESSTPAREAVAS